MRNNLANSFACGAIDKYLSDQNIISISIGNKSIPFVLYNIRKIIFIKAHAFKRLMIIKREFSPLIRHRPLRHGYWAFIVSLKYYYEQSKTIRGLDGWP